MRRLRLFLTGQPAAGCIHDTLTGAQAAIWDADALTIEIFIADIEDRTEPFDIDTITTLELEIRADEETTALLVDTKEPDSALTACTLPAWQADIGYHAAFTFTGSELNFANTITEFWLTLRATLDDGSPLTLAAGYVKFVQSRHGSSADPADTAAGAYLYLTSATPDADGCFTITARGKSFKLIPLSLTDA